LLPSASNPSSEARDFKLDSKSSAVEGAAVEVGVPTLMGVSMGVLDFERLRGDGGLAIVDGVEDAGTSK